MTGQVFPDLPQTPPPEPPADPPAQEEPAKALTPAQEMADALSAPEVETPDVSDLPFCRAMGLIAGGLAVTGVTLNFWNLDVLLPLVGTFCLLVGFRALRRVNGFLRAGYVCACLHMLLLFVELGQDAVIYRADTGLAAFFTVVAAAVQLVLLFCLWQGLLDMQRDAGITPPAAPRRGRSIALVHSALCRSGIVCLAFPVARRLPRLVFLPGRPPQKALEVDGHAGLRHQADQGALLKSQARRLAAHHPRCRPLPVASCFSAPTAWTGRPKRPAPTHR